MAISSSGKPNFQVLVNRLKNGSKRVKIQAALALGRLKDPEAVYYLIDCLKDSNSLVRGACARALGMLGDDRALTPLMNLVNDKSKFVKKWAGISITQLINKDTQFKVLLKSFHNCNVTQQNFIKDAIATVVFNIPNWDIVTNIDLDDNAKQEQMAADIEDVTLPLIIKGEVVKNKVKVEFFVKNFRVLEGKCKTDFKNSSEFKQCFKGLVDKLTKRGRHEKNMAR